MNNTTLQIKFKKRLNKIDSQDYDNIQSWEIAEAFNKAQIEWCRRQLAGTNMRQEGDEMSKRRIDDLSILLKTAELTGVDIIYDNKFGYFQSTNFGNIYNPNLGGDYLEFKRIECNSQQCFPFIPSQTITNLVDEVTEIPGYWNPGGITTIPGYFTPDVTREIFNVLRLPTFTFISHGSNVITIPKTPWDQNIVEVWGDLGPAEDYCNGGGDCQQGGIFPGEQPSVVTTQEPWVYNQNLLLEFPYIIDGATPWGPEGTTGEYGPVYNNNIIIPFGALSDSNDDGITNACDLCGNTASQIINNPDLLNLACSNNGIGWLVGGPNNEYINCNGGGAGFATSSEIVDLNSLDDADGVIYDENNEEVLTYNYTNTPNTWINNSESVFGESAPGMFCNSGCWFRPSSVNTIGYSLNNWQTTPGDWVEPVDIQNPDTWVDATTEVSQVEEVTNIPFQQCYCAPGADQDNFCTKPRSMTVYQSEVANVDVILRDPLKRPDFEWAETFCTFQSDNVNPQIKIWRKDFFVMDPILVYYRVPRRIEIVGSVDPYTGVTVAADINCEFKDDIVELIIDSAAAIIAGDISDANQMGRGSQESEKNN